MISIESYECNPVRATSVELSSGDFRRSVMALQEQMIAMPDELKIDPPVTHHFAPGQYARQMDIPAGTVIIGKIHKHAHVNVISKGTGYVATEFGKQAYAAPMTFISEPGTKRAVYAETDTVWTTVHVTNETDLVKIEDEIIAPSYDALLRLA